MPKTKRTGETAIRHECMGGCGKRQTVRPSNVKRGILFFGCGNCDGYRKAQQAASAAVAPGLMMVQVQEAAGGFVGWTFERLTAAAT